MGDEDTAHAAQAAPLRRGYRHIDWIELALELLRRQLDDTSFERLVSRIALCTGSEALLALRDNRGLDHAGAEEVSRWAARALLHASFTESNALGTASPPRPPER